MTEVLLTREYPQSEFARALESWDWLDFTGKTPFFASLFGDVFFVSTEGYWFLDTLEGTLDRVWTGRESLEADLATEDGRDRWLKEGFVMGAMSRGVFPGEGEVYAFDPPPQLTGRFEMASLTTMSFVVYVHLTGQLIGQLRDKPPGFKITGFVFDPGGDPTGDQTR